MKQGKRLTAMALVGVMGAAAAAAGSMAAAQSKPPIKLGAPASAPTPTPTPIKLGKPAAPPPPAKPAETKNSIGDPQEIFKFVLTQPLKPVPYEWQAGAPPTLLPKVETHICLLTEVSGNFAGGGEKVQLAIDKGASGGARWVLRGESGNGVTRAVATCAERQRFVPVADKSGTAIASERALRVFSSCEPDLQLTDKGNHPARAAFLSTVSGTLRGGGEALSADVESGNSIVQRGIACSGFVAGAITLHGDTTWPVVRYRTQTSRTTDVKAATFLNSLTQPGQGALSKFLGGAIFTSVGTPLWLVPVDEALCGLTMVSGKFQGYGEAVQIAAVKHSDGRLWWRLDVGNETNGGLVAAGARCIARDQRP